MSEILKCKNCGHGLINIGRTIYHSGITKKGISYNQKLCWQEDCNCEKPEIEVEEV